MIRKIFENFGFRAFNLLGIRVYIKMLSALVLQFFVIIKMKNLQSFSKAMRNIGIVKVKHENGEFFVNISQLDKNLSGDDSYSFSSILELYIRNCYFRGHEHLNINKIKTVVDLGANRGMFSALCTPFAEKIIAVEVQEKYLPSIKNCFEINNFSNFQIINSFIGQKGMFVNLAKTFVSFDDLLKNAKIDSIDFLKIDIEGGEFSLFTENIPWQKIKYISMEVHSEFGQPEVIYSILKEQGFNVRATTSSFDLTDDPTKIEYIYAENLLF
jgi:hypothetical protein